MYALAHSYAAGNKLHAALAVVVGPLVCLICLQATFVWTKMVADFERGNSCVNSGPKGRNKEVPGNRNDT